MIKIGDINTLKVIEELPFGYFLQLDQSEDDRKVFMSNLQSGKHLNIDDIIDGFVYPDEDGNMTASTTLPKLKVNEFAVLTATGVSDFAAFFDWGYERDLMVPRKYQHKPLDEGMDYVVYLFHDEMTNKLIGSTKLFLFLNEENHEFEPQQAVQLLIFDETPLGYKAVINNTHIGLLFKSDLFKQLSIGDIETGYIKDVREDGKINLSLQRPGKAGIKDLSAEIIDDLKAHGGISTLTDKSSAEEILARFNVSKGTYKKAIGGLYREKKISLSKTHIKLC